MLHAAINHAYSAVRTFWGFDPPTLFEVNVIWRWQTGKEKTYWSGRRTPRTSQTVWFIRIWSLKQLLHSRSTYRRVNMLSMCAAFISGWKADFFFYHGLIPIVNNLISILHLENPTRVYMWIICTGKFLLTGCLKFKSAQGKLSFWGVFYFIRKRKSKSLVKFFLVW